MLRFLKKDWLLVLVLLGVAGHLGYTLYTRPVPCVTPIAYGIASYDERFGMTKAQFAARLDAAAAVWNEALGKEVLVPGAEPKLPVYVVYDERQRTTDAVERLSDSIDDKKAQATRLGNEYDAAAARGASAAELNRLAADYNRLVDEINADVSQINRTIPQEEYNEGRYVSDKDGARIYIYEFNGTTQLARILEHELGHALGLEHVESKGSIMYPVNEGASTKLSKDDLAELARACGFK